MYRILVPYDFTSESENALKHALSIARNNEVKITVMYVASHGDVPSFHTQGQYLSSDADEIAFIDFLKQVQLRLEEVVKQMMAETFVDRVKVLVANYEKTVEEIILDEQSDLILMGTEGFHASEEIFFSSTTETVTAAGKTPVLVVQHNTPIKRITDVLYGSNFENEHDLNAASLAQLLRNIDANLHLVKVLSETGENLEKLRQRISKVGNTIQANPTKQSVEIIFSDEVVSALQLYAEKNNIEVIAINCQKLDGLFRFFRDNIVEEIVNRVNKPILLLNQD